MVLIRQYSALTPNTFLNLPRLFFKMSHSSRSRAFSRRSPVRSSALWARPPLPGDAVSPWVSRLVCHLYRWLRRKPNSWATADAGRPEGFQSRIASTLNSLVNRCRFAFRHLHGVLSLFESGHAHRARSECPRFPPTMPAACQLFLHCSELKEMIKHPYGSICYRRIRATYSAH